MIPSGTQRHNRLSGRSQHDRYRHCGRAAQYGAEESQGSSRIKRLGGEQKKGRDSVVPPHGSSGEP